jgi:hypothetical protein
MIAPHRTTITGAGAFSLIFTTLLAGFNAYGGHTGETMVQERGQAPSARAAPHAKGKFRITGDKLFLRGILEDWAGDFRNRVEIASDGTVSFHVSASEVAGNENAELLFDLVNNEESFVFYAGTDGNAVADLFVKDCKIHPREKIAKIFNGEAYTRGGWYIIGTKGRPGVPQPAGDVFAAVAFNINAVVIQTAINKGFAGVATAEQEAGLGQSVAFTTLYIHEAAEILEFAAQKHRGEKLDYNAAHTAAMRREALIRKQRNLTGGFAGGGLIFTPSYTADHK